MTGVKNVKLRETSDCNYSLYEGSIIERKQQD